MSILNTKIFGYHLDRDINRIFFDEYTSLPTEYDKMGLRIMDAPPGNHYIEAEMSPLGTLRTILEGQGVTFDDPIEGHKKTIYYTKYGLAIQITKEMMDDSLNNDFRRLPQKLAKSAVNKVETQVADLFNSGFGTHLSWDGQFIFDTDHTTLKSGETISNDGTAASISETSLLAAFEYYDALIDEAGYPLLARPKQLIIPYQLRGTAERVLRTSGIVGSANNDVNLVGPQGYANFQLFVNHYLTSSTAWFVTSDLMDFRLLWKDRATLSSKDDWYTDNALFKVIMRFAVFCMDYKGVYGNVGA